MPCFHPLYGYRSRALSANGKRPVVFNPTEGFTDLPVTVPCGGCSGCRLDRARQWAIRCMHEASLYERNCFVTLTYSDEFLPQDGSLDKGAFPRFMKRLRKRYPSGGVRYYHCGEYGDTYGRPHYHAILFNFDFGDKFWSGMRGDSPVFRSAELEKLWPYGRSELGSVTFKSAAYVARYVMKKVTGDYAEEYYQSVNLETGEVVKLEPEYTTMSRRPGIGKEWFRRFGSEVFPSDEVIVDGNAVKPPRFYFSQFEVLDPHGARQVAKRRERARKAEEETPERLEVRERCLAARLARLERKLE